MFALESPCMTFANCTIRVVQFVSNCTISMVQFHAKLHHFTGAIYRKLHLDEIEV